MSRRTIDPAEWIEVANRRRPKLPQTTQWFDGTTAPVQPGWYERHFTDSPTIGNATMQWWDGEYWRAKPEWAMHWRQVGDYPAWRGLSSPSPAHSSGDIAAKAGGDHGAA